MGSGEDVSYICSECGEVCDADCDEAADCAAKEDDPEVQHEAPTL